MDANNEKIQGEVKWYDPHKGYGVLVDDNQNEYFIHHTNLSFEQKQLFAFERVAFLLKPRQHGKEGLEAYEIDILPPSPVEENDEHSIRVQDILRKMQGWFRMRASFQREYAEQKAKWNVWDDMADEYIEFQEPLIHIQNTFNLEMIPAHPDIIAKAFTPGNDMPVGAFTRAVDIDDYERRRGVYACMGNDELILIVHAFYKSRKTRIDCWRAKIFRRRDGKIISMPDKGTYTGHFKRNIWRERFDYFLQDIQHMMAIATRNRMSTNDMDINDLF